MLYPITWRVHALSSPDIVYEMLATSAGRSRFWAESAEETEGTIQFVFSNGITLRSEIVEAHPPRRFSLRYFANSLVTFELVSDGRGGTDLTLTDAGVPAAEVVDTLAGWVSVLLTLKAAVDHGADLRNHDPKRSWDQRFVDN
jgi:hypothetical protein